MIVYDEETYPNLFTLTALDVETENVWVFEMSERRNDLEALIDWCRYLQANKIPMVGYNNIGFDYPILHMIMSSNGMTTVDQIYAKCQAIIGSFENRFAHVVWPNDQFIPQIDLFKIHHFDNAAKSVSLKALQFNMRSESVEDLPIPVGTHIPIDRIDDVLSYNLHDVTETAKFLKHSMDQINFRKQLSEMYQRDFMNHNDTKIGKDFFIMKLEEHNPTVCFDRSSGRKTPRQTPRNNIPLNKVIFPYIKFDHPELNRALEWLKSHTVINTKGSLGLTATIDGFTFVFGTGGIHGSIENTTVFSVNQHVIIDLDVASYYPNIAIKNRVFPEHLGETFCDIYLQVYNERKKHKKGTAENAMFKLALNGVYGDSNNKYSPFYDPQYTMSITINGQLLLCMLAEKLMTIPSLEMIQINTDGLTVRLHRAFEWMLKNTWVWWESYTCLQLEEARYTKMAVRDVNNYLAITEGGKIKRKGAYDSRRAGERFDVPAFGWYQNTSSLIIPMAAEAAILHGVSVQTFIYSHEDPFDFMICVKTKGTDQLIMTYGDDATARMQKTSRVFVVVDGGELTKISPPPPGEVPGWFKRAPKVNKADYDLWHAEHGNVHNPAIHTKNKSIYDTRVTGVLVGWKCAVCNQASQFDWLNVNYEYYIAEAEKLVAGVN